jgi:hypothetical protein
MPKSESIEEVGHWKVRFAIAFTAKGQDSVRAKEDIPIDCWCKMDTKKRETGIRDLEGIGH